MTVCLASSVAPSLRTPPNACLSSARVSSARAYPSDITACHRLLHDLNATLIEQDATLVTKDATILNHDTLITERNRIIAAHVALVEQRNWQLEEQKAELAKAI